MKSEDLIGKALPNKKDLEFVKSQGFEKIELGLRKEDLKDINKTINLVESVGIKIISVHTPHVVAEDLESFLKSAEIARYFDALLVFHSNRIPVTQVYEIFNKIDYPNKAVEANPGISLPAIENCFLKNNCNFILDIAHLYIASDNLIKNMKYLFENYRNKIKLIHLSDSSPVEDNLPLGKGNINLEEVVRFLDRNYDSKIIIEVMPEFQKEEKEKVMKILGLK